MDIVDRPFGSRRGLSPLVALSAVSLLLVAALAAACGDRVEARTASAEEASVPPPVVPPAASPSPAVPPAATPPAAAPPSAPAAAPAAAPPGPAGFQVPPPPFSEGIFPCSDCHADMEVNPTRRTLEEEHTNIVLRHDEEHRWCLDCHDPTDRDKLRLASGERIGFEESYRLCGQCHGDKYRDWRAGVHGKRTGMWDGEKRYLLCAHCHNPHAPRFAPIAPKPAPKRPEEAR